MEKSEEKLVMSMLFAVTFSKSFEGFEAAKWAFWRIWPIALESLRRDLEEKNEADTWRILQTYSEYYSTAVCRR